MIWSFLSTAIAVATWLIVVHGAELETQTRLGVCIAFTALGLMCGIVGARADRSNVNRATSKLAISLHVLSLLCRYSYAGQEFAEPVDKYPALSCTMYNSQFVKDLSRRGFVRGSRTAGSVNGLLKRSVEERWVPPFDGLRPPSCSLVEVDLPSGYPPGFLCNVHAFYFTYDGRVMKPRSEDLARSLDRLSW